MTHPCILINMSYLQFIKLPGFTAHRDDVIISHVVVTRGRHLNHIFKSKKIFHPNFGKSELIRKHFTLESMYLQLS